MIVSKVHAIWSRELRLDEFSDDDNFFSLGGNSLIMARIQREISTETGITVPMDILFTSTVAEVSDHIEAAMAVG
ncbi:acyl carrier protein [Streptomyces cyaneofuscatus]